MFLFIPKRRHAHACVHMVCSYTHSWEALGQQLYLWDKRGFVQVWKIKPRYFWQLETAECLDHYLEPTAESAVEMWVRGAGGPGSQDLLKP